MAKIRTPRSGGLIDWFDPGRWLSFIETKVFTDCWKEMSLGIEELLELQEELLKRPDAGSVVKGTGGLRKVRFAPTSRKTGKSGAARVCYVHFQEYGILLLVVAYAKGEQDDLTAGEKQAIRTHIEGQRKALAEHLKRGPRRRGS